VVKDQISQRNSETMGLAKSRIMVKDQDNQRNSETLGLAKSRFRQGLIKRVAKGQDQKNTALIPNETNKVRSHKNNPKYLEYNKVIHIGL
jgi:hypothetical protein